MDDIDLGVFTFGELLKFLRKQRGFTQVDLAAAAGYGEDYISKLERGDRPPSQAVAKQLARGLCLDGDRKDLFLRLASEHQRSRPSREDWGDAPSIKKERFYGRAAEVARAAPWVRKNQCLVAILGLGGIGKTALARSIAETVKEHFEYIFWRSLENAAPLETILQSALLLFSDQQRADLPHDIDQQMLLLIHYLRAQRCLFVLDNVDAIMVNDRTYRPGYELYGKFFRQIAEVHHQSCLLLTSRIKLPELAFLSSVHTLQLSGLSEEAGHQLLLEKGVTGTDDGYRLLVSQYSGNPLALQIVADSIRNLFDGDIDCFLREETIIFGDVSSLLGQQILPLSELERDLMYWLAIEREPVTLSALQANVKPFPTRGALLGALEGLLRRSLVEARGSGYFGLQPVVMEYVTNDLVERVSEEIETTFPRLLASHALTLAQAKDDIRESQVHLILSPIRERLLSTLGKENTLGKCQIILEGLRQPSGHQRSYAAGNILRLLVSLESGLTGYDFSHLSVWQTHLQGATLHNVNFSCVDFSSTTFTYPFDAVIGGVVSPDGTQLATASTTNEVMVWDASHTIPIPLFVCQHQQWVYAIAFSPDGRLLASGCDDHMVRLWDVKSGELLTTFYGHSHAVRSLAFSPDGELLASCGIDQTVRLWNVESRQLIHTFQDHHCIVWSVVFSPDGELLASCGIDQTVRLWNVKSRQLIRTFSEPNLSSPVPSYPWPMPLAWSPDGRLLASGGSDQSIRLWEIDSGQVKRLLLGHTGWIMSLAWSPDGRLLASGGSDQSIRLWEIDSGQVKRLLLGHSRRVWSVVFHPHREILISGSDDQTIRFWDIRRGQSLNTLYGRRRVAVSVAFHPTDNDLLASSCDEPGIWMWDTTRGEALTILQGHGRGVWSVAFSPDGKLLASGGDDHTVRLWDVSTRRFLHCWPDHQSYVWSVVWSPDSRLLASCSDDQTIRVWDVYTKKCCLTLPGQNCWVWSMAFSPDGKILASGSNDRSIQLWDTENGTLLQSFSGHADWIRSLAFSPDGKILASGGNDQSIRLWDAESGQIRAILQDHQDLIRSVVFSPDGEFLASGSNDHTVRLWKVSSGQLHRTLSGHTHQVWSVSFSPDKERVASGSHDGTIRIWKVATGECLQVLVDRPYKGMNLLGSTGLTSGQKSMLRQLGAIG